MQNREGIRLPSDSLSDISSPDEIKDALERASDYDLLDEVLRRRLVREFRFWELFHRRELRGAKEVGRGPLSVEEELELLRANRDRHNEYVGQLFNLLHQKRLDKMHDQCIWRTDTTPEFAGLGIFLTKMIFDHLVAAWRGALDAGTSNIESIWEYFMSDKGYSFATEMVEAGILVPPDHWSSFIYHTIQGAAESFLNIVEEDAEESADQDNVNACKEPHFIN